LTPEEEDLNRQPIVSMEIGSLELSGSPRLAGADPDHLEALIAAEQDLPPIVVHRPTMRVVDGAHRVRAAQRRGEATIRGRYYDGTEEEAFVLSVWLNVTHGLPLSLADRKRAAERIATSHPQWSDRRIAVVTGISAGTVAEIRRRSGATQPGGSRVGQDGRARPLDPSAGRRLAGQLMTENPRLSLRQVAKAAAISPETVRDVRNRLLSGEEVVPARRGRAVEVPATARTGHGRALNLIPPSARPDRPVTDRTAVVGRLTGDPSLRYTETGRNLLRLLSLHAHWTKEWDTIVENVPPHCTDAVADLAREFSDMWADFAVRVRPAKRMAG
jgi:ParB-like chromosome segregation protein Spo0J